MNHSKSTLRASTRIVPPDSLLKFGYTPNGAIEFDSAAALLRFSYSGTPKAEISAIGMALPDGEGLVIGHSEQLAIDGEVNQFSVFGTSSDDSGAHFASWSGANGIHPIIHGYKSRGTTIGSNVIVADNDGLLRIRALADDGVDDDTRVAELLFEVDDSSPAAGAIGGAITLHTATTTGTVTEALRITSAQDIEIGNGSLFIGDSANAKMTQGLTLNQGANDDEIFALKNSDVAHGYTGFMETDTFATFKKSNSALGGLVVSVGGEDTLSTPLRFDVRAGTGANTSHTTSARGMAEFQLSENNEGIVDADGNIFVIRRRVSGPTTNAAFVVDAEGDIFADGGSSTTNMVTKFDGEDDMSLVRTFDLSREGRGLIRTEWDSYVTHNESDLVKYGILGDTIANGGLVNVTRLQQLHNGAIWQLNTRHMSLVDRVDELTVELEVATKKLAALTAPGRI